MTNSLVDLTIPGIGRQNKSTERTFDRGTARRRRDFRAILRCGPVIKSLFKGHVSCGHTRVQVGGSRRWARITRACRERRVNVVHIAGQSSLGGLRGSRELAAARFRFSSSCFVRARARASERTSPGCPSPATSLRQQPSSPDPCRFRRPLAF